MTRELLVFDTKGNSLEDGPGIRSVIFFKGCPLNCLWCQNPEGKKAEAEIWCESERCVKDGGCMAVCPRGAISPDHAFFIDRNRCDGCFLCVEACASTALRLSGQKMGMEEFVQNVLRSRAYFEATGGGVTLAGGELMSAPEFVVGLLKRLKEEGIHTLLQTAGLFPLARFDSEVLPWLDAIYFDLKLADPALHRRDCATGNETIQKHFVTLSRWSRSMGFELLPRTPLIPGITDTNANLHGIADFLSGLGVERAALLPTIIRSGSRKGPDRDWPVTGTLEKRLGSFYETERLKEMKELSSNLPRMSPDP